MGFQFQCPQGHVLEGDPSQAGHQCQCPMCGILFIIPAPVSAPAPPAFSAPSAPAFPGVGASAPAVPAAAMAPPAEPKLLHIPCPNGHELETPPEMLDQEVLCPHCGVQFKLRERDSVEYKRRKQQQQEIRDRKLGNAWFNWAIIVAVLVLLGLILMIFSSSG